LHDAQCRTGAKELAFVIVDPLCPAGLPCRDGWWNIPIALRVVFFITIALAVGLMIYGIVQRIRLWRKGQPEPAFDHFWARVGRTLKYAVAQVRVLRQRYPAVMHLAIFWAMVLLLIGTILASLDTDVFEILFDAKLLKGNFYLLYKTVLDLAGLFGLVGIALAAYRRYVVKPDRLNTDWRFNLTLPLLAAILITGLLVESLRLAATQPSWAPFSVVAYPISRLFASIPQSVLLGLHRGLWIFHYLGVALFFASLPWTNLLHIFTSPANIFAAPFRDRGALHPIQDLEQAETLGVSKLTEFPRPRLVNVDACTECGRCQVVCPAHAAGQPLNPKKLVLDLQSFLTSSGPRLLGTASQGRDNGDAIAMVGGIVPHESLWSCTTCYACVHECPVLIEHVDDIVDMRRYLVLAEGAVPSSLGATLTNTERSGNPWKQSRRKRTAWTQGLEFEVPVMAQAGEADVLWWVGCAGAYDPRNQKVTRAIARILHAAGVNFAILGEEEQCTGDSARRAGNEYLFQTLARANIETLSRYKFQAILTQCPHCYNTLRHEYPQFGGDYLVYHHTQYIQALLAEENILVARQEQGKLAFHDPCYLGRYNDEYEAPRYAATSTGMSLVELPQTRAGAMCCGGGGARVWMEDEGEVRINRLRLAQVQAAGVEEVAVACPFCMIMLEDARGAMGADNLVVRDIAEIVADALVESVR
jgi:Fe-S oxidoreductase/nitrate reductase gamma subunit